MPLPGDLMRTLLKMIRGLLGVGAVGAVVGGGLVAILAGIVQLIDGAIIPQYIGCAFLAGSGLGLATTTVFGVVLAATSRGRRLEELSFWWATSVSGVLGALLPLALGALGGDAVPPGRPSHPPHGLVGVGPFATGFSIEKKGEGWYLQHSGGNWGFICNLMAHVSKGYGYAVMTNSSSGGRLIAELERRIQSVYGWDVLAEPVPRGIGPRSSPRKQRPIGRSSSATWDGTRVCGI